MFIGHYAPGILGASTGKIKLWQAFVGAQLVDYAWATLNLLGIEKTRIIEGFTEANPLDLYYMPYTHSFGMSIIWAVMGACLFGLIFRKQAKEGAILFGLVVMSHWFMDLIVHVRDLPIWFGTQKYGFGMWNHRMASFSFEIVIFALAMAVYLRKTSAINKMGKIWPVVVIVFMGALQVMGNFGPPPKSTDELGISGIFIYTVFALMAWGLDKTRRFKAVEV